MILALTAAFAADLDLSIGAFLGTHLSGSQHELYDAPDSLHGPLGPAFPFGLRAGIGLADPLHLEGEAFVGPASGVGAGLLYGWRAQALVRGPLIGDQLRPQLAVGFGNLGLSSTDLGSDLDMAAHIGPALDVAMNDQLSVRGDLRWVASARQGATSLPSSHGELLVGLVYRKRVSGDTDGDGVRDDKDGCVDEAEYPNGYEDQDGCPDALATLVVKAKNAEGALLRSTEVFDGKTSLGRTNLEGRLIVPDLMPGREVMVVVDTPDLEPATSTLVLQAGENEIDLELGWAPGTLVVTAKTLGGKPIPAQIWATGPKQERWTLDANGESTRILPPGKWNIMIAEETYDAHLKQIEIPAEPGPRVRVDAILRPQRVQLTSTEVLTLDPLEFAAASVTMRDGGADIVEAVGSALVNNPQVTKLEVAGYASTDANPKANLALSQKRAEAVVQALIALGVEPGRLVAVGYGEEGAPPPPKPGSKRQERRVQFYVREISGGPQ